MSRKQIFEIPENPDSVIFYAGREISIDGKTIVEVDTASACFRHLMTEDAREYCEKHWFNPVFVCSDGNLPMLIGFVFDEKSFNSFSCIPHGSPIGATLALLSPGTIHQVRAGDTTPSSGSMAPSRGMGPPRSGHKNSREKRQT